MSRLREAILPAYLLLCLLIGGSSQGVWSNMALQLLAICILAWAILTRNPQPMPAAGKRLLWIIGGLGLLFLVQLVPLPPATWTAIPGREPLAAGFKLLGMPLPWLPLSLSPYDTATTAVTLLPPLSLLVGMLRLRAWSAAWMFGAIVLAAVFSIMLGVLQVTGAGAWYFYPITNLGLAVGVFANANHFATLLMVAMPVLAALAATRWRSAKPGQQRSLTVALALAAAAVLLIGILINGSAALLLLGPPVAIASVLLALRLPPARLRHGLVAIGLLLIIGAAALVSLGKDMPGWGTSVSIESRTEYWSKTIRAAGDHGWTGTGFGTFEQVYRQYEDPGTIDRFYVNHAHNDYVEVALEGGLPALLLVALFLLWWAGRAREAWVGSAGTVEQKGAAVASAAILLHSAFDYPLRTAVIMAAMAVCLALLAGARGARRTTVTDGRPAAKHATL